MAWLVVAMVLLLAWNKRRQRQLQRCCDPALPQAARERPGVRKQSCVGIAEERIPVLGGDAGILAAIDGSAAGAEPLWT